MYWPDSADTLAEALRRAVLAQRFEQTPDSLQGGAPLGHHPSIDLALVVFAPGKAPRWANLLFSREHPQGIVAEIDARAGAPRNILFEADVQDPKGDSIAWLPGADWQRIAFPHLAGAGPHRFVAPYPASLLKLMVAVGVAMAMDQGLLDAWPKALEPMIVVSDNDATTECVALLHRLGLVDALNRRFAELGLLTLQLQGTKPDGGWRNADGSGVGRIQMTAWDTARLLWLLDEDAPPPPWLPAGSTIVSPVSRAHLRSVLQRQQLDHVLSSGSLHEVPGWLPGWPDAPAFAHKTGNTQNYSSDAGILRAGPVHAIVALLSSLGSRYAPDPRCASTWRLPALGAALHALLLQPGS